MYLEGKWIVNTQAPAIPYSLIPFDYTSDTSAGRRELYEVYGVEIKPIEINDDITVYGGTPYLTKKNEDGTEVKCFIVKYKEGESDYQYDLCFEASEDHNQVTVEPGDYNDLSVQWYFANAAAEFSVTVKYKDEPMFSLLRGQTATLHTSGQRMESDLIIKAEKTAWANLKKKEIFENGTYYPEEGYQGFNMVTVNVPVPEGYFKPTGELPISTNGKHNVSAYEYVIINTSEASFYEGETEVE